MQNCKVIPPAAHWATVTLTTDRLPDEIVAVAASFDDTLKYGSQTPFSDQLASLWAGGHWQYDALHDSIITTGNGGTQPTLAAFTVFYNQGTQKYQLQQTLQPGEQMWMDIGKLIRENVPDKDGKTLPPDLTTGSYELRDLTNKGVGTLFEGKVIYDKTYGHVVYGCAACCGWANPTLFYNPIGVPFQGSTGDGVTAWYPCESEYDDISSNFYSNWTSSNTGIVTVDTYGTHTGVAVGSTTSQTHGYYQTNNAHARCPNLYCNPSGNANATPKILFGGCSGTDITNGTQSVVVGQQISLCASYGNVTVNSQSWSLPGTIAASYTTSSTGGTLNTTVNVSQSSTTFYWIIPALSETVTFTLNYGNNQTATAEANFVIAAPSPSTPTVTLPTNGKLFIDTLTGCNGNPNAPYLVFGNISGPIVGCPGSYTGSPGIAFSPPTTVSPPGTFFFVQLITEDFITYDSLDCSATPGLDGAFPYQSKTGQSVNDAPFAPLPSTYSSVTRNFAATMFLMWQSNTQGSIPALMAYVGWSFSSTTNQSGGVWSTPSNVGGAGSWVVPYSASEYPAWPGLAVPASQNCH